MHDAGKAKDAQGLRMPPSEEVREEIERAIDNAKGSPWDRWFRGERYRAAALRQKWWRTAAGRKRDDRDTAALEKETSERLGRYQYTSGE